MYVCIYIYIYIYIHIHIGPPEVQMLNLWMRRSHPRLRSVLIVAIRKMSS